MAFTILVAAADDARKDIVHKGKSTKYWPHLPPEIIRLIATYYLLNVAATSICPATWGPTHMWPSRFVFTLLRDALKMENLMCVYPSWAAALEVHPFWRQACAIIDPNDALIHHSIVRPTAGSAASHAYRLSPYQHFRNITNCSCIVCRINVPYSSTGLAMAKRLVMTPHLGTISTCKEHRRTTFCGVCLREAPVLEGEYEYAQGLSVCCVENEDDKVWPGVEATCRICRGEALWRHMESSVFDREAIGGRQLAADDWETRQAVEAFVDLGEGTISDVITIARDKHWYKLHTRLGDMLSQALAASRYAPRVEAGDGYISEEEISDEDEDDAELMSITEDAAGIREIALAHYARNRILDGLWIDPGDVFQGNPGSGTVPPAQHPCPWNPDAVYTGACDDGEEMSSPSGEVSSHPRPKTVEALVPPSAMLCNMAHFAFVKQLREILMPAMHNVVRRLAIECAADGKDPAVVAARMSLEDIAEALRDEAVWFNGIDWMERRANAQEHERHRRREKDEDDSSLSSRSDGSHTTSPVLSTTTLQTTPSPPPSGSVSAKDDEYVLSPSTSNPPAIEVAPNLRSPKLIHPIPYIPVSIAEMPQYTREAFRDAWRDARAPLFECYCSVCERRILKANAAANKTMSTHETAHVQESTPTQPPIQISLPTVPIEPLNIEEEEEDGESEADSDASVVEIPALPVTPRKRPSQELDADVLTSHARRDDSPPKRQRKDGTYSPTAAVPPTPERLRKRSSEELENDDSQRFENGESKRLKAEVRRALPLPRTIGQKTSIVTPTAT